MKSPLHFIFHSAYSVFDIVYHFLLTQNNIIIFPSTEQLIQILTMSNIMLTDSISIRVMYSVRSVAGWLSPLSQPVTHSRTGSEALQQTTEIYQQHWHFYQTASWTLIMETEKFINIGVIVIGHLMGKVIKLKDKKIAALKHCRIKGLFTLTFIRRKNNNDAFYYKKLDILHFRMSFLCCITAHQLS